MSSVCADCFEAFFDDPERYSELASSWSAPQLFPHPECQAVLADVRQRHAWAHYVHRNEPRQPRRPHLSFSPTTGTKTYSV